jgi:hypothetical protein
LIDVLSSLRYEELKSSDDSGIAKGAEFQLDGLVIVMADTPQISETHGQDIKFRQEMFETARG